MPSAFGCNFDTDYGFEFTKWHQARGQHGGGTWLEAGGRLTINTLTRGAERREQPGGAPDPSKPSKNEKERLARG